MSRKKLKNRRRKDRAQRKILIAAVCIAAVIIGVGIGGHVIKKNAGKTMTTAETESKKAVSKKKATAKKLTINENETDASNKENQGQKDQADDRSEFAVQPGRKVGTTEQSDEKVVYLTLDDGPSKNTQAVLDILDKYNAKATFFVTGAMPEYKDMIKKAYDKGHTIGMHTYSHDYAKVYASVDAYFQDLDQIGQLVKEEIGYVPCFIRFPGGSSNTISASYTKGIMTTLTQEQRNSLWIRQPVSMTIISSCCHMIPRQKIQLWKRCRKLLNIISHRDMCSKHWILTAMLHIMV